MADVITLYDTRSGNFPKIGEHRTIQVFVCDACGSRTNLAFVGGYMMRGIYALCPNAARCWHHEIEERLELLLAPHPAFYRNAVKQEIATILTEHTVEIRDDFVGNPDTAFTIEIGRLSVHPDGCLHE